MSVTININGNLTLDQTAGLQEDDVNVDAAGAVLSGDLDSQFLDFLNTLGISTGQADFAALVEGASDPGLVTIDATAGETIGKLAFSDSAGEDFDGDLVPDVTTLDGSPLYFWTALNGKSVIVTTSNVSATDGDVVAAFYIEPTNAEHTEAKVESITFQPMLHTDTDNNNDAVDFSDILRVSAVVTQNVGDDIIVLDDGPSIVLSDTSTSLTVDETLLGTDDEQSFAGDFTPDFGTDGAGTTGGIAYALSANDGDDSGLIDSATGDPILLFNAGGTIEGRVLDDTGDVAFIVSVDVDGNVKLDQITAVIHDPDTGPDQSTTLLSDDLIKLTATITDGDGDHAEQVLNIGQNLNFEDDAPTAPSLTANASVIEDESAGVNDTADPNDADDTNNAAAIALFANVPGTNIDVAKSAAPLVNLVGGGFGNDGAAGSDSVVYDVSVTDATFSGVSTTDGTQVFLYNGTGLLEGLILGRVGTEGGVNPDTADAAGAIAFAIAVDEDGFGYIAHKAGIAIANPSAGSTAAAFDDVISLTGDAIKISVTYTDKDGDQATTDPANVGAQFTFQDSGPSITVAVDYPGTATALNLGNQVGDSNTGAFGYDLGTDNHGAAFYTAGGSDFVDSNGGVAGTQISLTGTVDNAQNPGITSAVATLASESDTSAVFNFSFNYDKDPITAGVQSASAGGTLTFDKAADTFSIAINDVVDGFDFSVLHTNELLAKAPIGNNGHPNIVVEQLAVDDPNTAGNEGFYVQFTADNSPFGFSANGQGGNTADHSFTQGAHDMIGGTPTWVSATQSTNGVAGDTIQSGENLTLRFFNENILADVAANVEKTTPTDSVSGIALKFDGIGANEDLVMILDLIDPVTHATITRSVTIENGDIYKNSTPGGVPFPYSTEFSLDNNDGLVIIESNDYNLAGEHYEIQGVQIMQSANGQTGSGINLQKAIGAAGGSVTNVASLSAEAWNFAGSHTTDVLKITDIGFVEQSSGTIDADLHFQFALADADADTTATQTIDAHISNLFNV